MIQVVDRCSIKSGWFIPVSYVAIGILYQADLPGGLRKDQDRPHTQVIGQSMAQLVAIEKDKAVLLDAPVSLPEASFNCSSPYIQTLELEEKEILGESFLGRKSSPVIKDINRRPPNSTRIESYRDLKNQVTYRNVNFVNRCTVNITETRALLITMAVVQFHSSTCS